MDARRQVRKLFRASEQRLKAAACLLENGFHLESIYLAGYAVECALKGLILKRTPRNKYAESWRELTEVGAKGHNLEYLKSLLRIRNCLMNAETVESFNRVALWSTQLRYEVQMKEYNEAARFLQAAKELSDWCRGK